jgi:hypothetical protein
LFDWHRLAISKDYPNCGMTVKIQIESINSKTCFSTKLLAMHSNTSMIKDSYNFSFLGLWLVGPKNLDNLKGVRIRDVAKTPEKAQHWDAPHKIMSGNLGGPRMWQGVQSNWIVGTLLHSKLQTANVL